MTLDAIFKAYDVRGLVPEQINEEISEAVGVGFASMLQREEPGTTGPVLVGRDMRTSGEALSKAFTAGLLQSGMDVIDIGMVSTDLTYFASGKLDSPAAMFTASHNPASYNGIKLCRSSARPIGQESGLLEVKQRATDWLSARSDSVENGAERREKLLEEARASGSWREADMLQAYAEHVRSFVDLSALKPLKVVADTANGMGGLVAPAVFGPLPFHLEILFPELDGNFPNHPADPIQPENLRFLVKRVVETKADVGLAFDGDADRVFLVDERGGLVSGSLTTALVARSMLEKHPGATILYNCICSKVVPETIEEHGGHAIRTRVGHSFIKQVMAETGAVFGGEHSGHYYFKDNYRADSGTIAALVILELMSKSGKSLSEMLKPYKRYADSGEQNIEVANPQQVVQAIGEELARRGMSVDWLDGATADGGSWWCNVRPSNTEPLVRVNVEASTQEECEARTQEIVDLVKELGEK